MVVLAVPLTGVSLAAAVIDEALERPAAAVSAARLARTSNPDTEPVTVPLASLLAAPAATTLERAADPAPAPTTLVRSTPRAVPRPARPPGAADYRHDFLISADGTLSTPVGNYSDCTGRSPLPRTQAAIDTCYWDPAYFLGHNLGVFSPLMHMGVGSLITYYDSHGQAHMWRVVFVHESWRIGPGRPQPARQDVVAQFQTCVSGDGSVARVLDVVNA